MAGEKVTRNTAYLTAAFVGQKLLSFLYFTIIARLVGVDGAGRYFIAVSFTTIWSVFVDLGLANVLVREVAKDVSRAGQLLANVLGLKVVFAAVAVAGALGSAALLGYPDETRLMIGIAAAVMVLDSIHLVFYAVMRGFQNLKYEAVGVVTGQAVTITVGTIGILAGAPLPILVVALLAGSSWNVLWSVWALTRKFGIGLRFALDPAIVRFFWSVTVPFALAGIFSRVYSYIDSIMLSKLVSETAVGIYGAAYKVAFAFQFMPMAFAAAIYPAMSEYYVSDRARLGKLYATALQYLFVIAAPLAFGTLAVARPVILAVFGEPFLASVVPLQILMFSLVFAFLYWPAGSLLNACDRQAKNTRVMGVTMLINIAANAVLLPFFSSEGAAVAALIGNAVLFAGAYWYARDLAPYDRARLRHSMTRVLWSAGVMWVVVAALGTVAHFVVTVPVGVAVYAGMLLASGGLSRDEMRALAGILTRRGRGVSDIVA